MAKAVARTGFEAELSASISQTLRQVALRNEQIISYVRVVAVACVTVLDYLLYLQPPGLELPYAFPISSFYLAAGWLAGAVAVAALLRRGWYPAWVRIALPLLDGLVLLSLNLTNFGAAVSAGDPTAALVNTGVACGLLAMSGALRLSRQASWVTTLLAVGTFVSSAVMGGVPLLELIFTCTLLVAVGWLGMWMGEIVRHSMESEVGRRILARFLPEEVVDGAHRQPLALIARPRTLVGTVLVSDLRNFTTASERLPPAEVLERLSAIQGALAATVSAHGGRVDKFMGDGMLAVFGLDDERANHARMGVEAALAIRRSLPTLGQGAEPIQVGIGLHTGPIVAGCLGSGLRLEFTVIGDTVNTASRLQSLTKELGVDLLISGQVYEQATADGGDLSHPFEPLGPVAIRGRQMPVELRAPAPTPPLR